MVVADQTNLICRFEPAGRLTFVNPAFCRFHAKEDWQLLGTDFYETLPEDEANKLRESLQTLTAENAVVNFDRRAEAAAGHVEWHQCSIRRLRRDDGQVEFQAVMQDITARKRAELSAQEARDSLEKVNLQLQAAAAESVSYTHLHSAWLPLFLMRPISPAWTARKICISPMFSIRRSWK